MKNYFTNPEKSQKLRLLLYDAIVVLFVFLLSYTIRIMIIEGERLLSLPTKISWLIVPGVVIHLLSFYIFGLYEISLLKNRKLILINIFFSVFLATVVITLLSFTFPKVHMGRILISIQFILMNMALCIWRFTYLEKMFKNGRWNAIIVGWNSLVEKIYKNINKKNLGYSLAGVVIGPGNNVPPSLGNPIPVFNSLDEALIKTGARTIIITEDVGRLDTFKSRLMDLRFKGYEIFSGPSFYERAVGKVPVSEISEGWLLYCGREGAFQPLIYVKSKRIIDLVTSALMLIMSLPLFLLISLAIKVDSKGPIFFKQERLGVNEKPFTLIKFRTMVDGAEKSTGPCWATENDPRYTRIGRFLRKTRMDELPQFINVLRGDMSLVGPRPIRKYFADIFSLKFPFYRLRFKVKPGITGWAQVNMDYVNSEEDQYEKLEYEFYYLYHQSIFLDLFIILKTVQSMLKMRGK